MESFPAIVVGGGTMGLAAAAALARRGVRSLVLERFSLVHSFGSHGGRVRIIRQAYAEGADYVPLARRADALWVAAEHETGRRILHRVGGLDLAAAGYGRADRARGSALQHEIPGEWLDGAEISRRWPAWRLDQSWSGFHSPSSGYLAVDPALRALAEQATRGGAEIRTGERVVSWEASDRGVRVETDRGAYAADRLVVTAGAWAGRLLSSLGMPLRVERKVVWWLGVESPEFYAGDRFPIFVAECGLGTLYGFPTHDVSALRIASHSAGTPADPETVDRSAHPDEVEQVLPFARGHLRGVRDEVVESAVCLYTLTPDEHFVVDRHPVHPSVVFGAGFSGHGFKFAPAIGELLADLALDERARPHSPFALSRLQAT